MARGQLPRKDTRRTYLTGVSGNRPGPRRGEGAPHPGRVRLSSSWLPELLGQGKAQNAGPIESTLLWNIQKLELHATQGPLHIEQPAACSVEMGKAHTCEQGKPSVAGAL